MADLDNFKRINDSHGSIGVHTVWPGETTDPKGALELADEALYRAKRECRNCVRHSLDIA